MTSPALAWPPWRRHVDSVAPVQGIHLMTRLVALSLVTAVVWVILVVVEMASFGSLATPNDGIPTLAATGLSEIGDLDAQDPACHFSPDHPESWTRLPDLRGGTVYQVHQADAEMPPQHIWWDPVDGAEHVVVQADANTSLRPYTVSGTTARPILWFTVGVQGAAPTDHDVALYRLDLLSGEQSLVVPNIGSFEIQPLLVTVSDAGLLVSNADSTGSWLDRFDHDGSRVTWSTNPHPVSNYAIKAVYGSLSNDGEYIASIETENGAPWLITIRHAASGEIISSDQLGQEIRRVVHADASREGFSFIVETADAGYACVSVPYPTG